METLESVAGRNIADLRSQRGYSVRVLSVMLSELGVKLLPSGITKVEQGKRGISISELVAFAITLGVSPNRLLLPAECADEHEPVVLTPNKSSEWHLAWRWVAGEQPLLTHEEAADMDLTDKRVREFSDENQPYLDRPVVEANRQFQVRGRIRTPYRYTIWNDGEKITANSTWGSKALRELAEHEEDVAQREEERARVLGEGADDGQR